MLSCRRDLTKRQEGLSSLCDKTTSNLRKSKKVKRAENKAKRKRYKNARAKSQTSASVPNVHP